MNEILCKRIYDAPEPDDGFRVLVDRLWPRGIKKDAAELDLWAKKIAPTGELRKWFGHDPEKFREFCDRYCQELDENPDAPDFVRLCSETLLCENITLLYAAKDPTCNHALALRRWLQDSLSAQREQG